MSRKNNSRHLWEDGCYFMPAPGRTERETHGCGYTHALPIIMLYTGYMQAARGDALGA